MATTTEIAGYIASALVLTAFAINDLRRLRMIAILSNIAFITYGVLAWLLPVVILHLLLLPLNVALLIGFGKVLRGVPSSTVPCSIVELPADLGSAVRKRSARSYRPGHQVAPRLSIPRCSSRGSGTAAWRASEREGSNNGGSIAIGSAIETV
jgi:hypothetical protein